MVTVQWSSAHVAAWDGTPDRYVEAGVVKWGRSRRLGKYAHDALGLKAYVGIQHFDPGRWGVEGDARATFFLSIFVDRRTVALRTFATIDEALAALEVYQAARVASLNQ